MRQTPLAALCGLDDPRETLAAVRVCGDLNAAIAAAANHPRQHGLDDLVRLKTALENRDDPARMAARLRAAAARLDQRTQRLLTEGADFLGRAAYRRAQGDHELATDFARRGEAAEALAGELSEQALFLALRAAEIERRHAAACHLAGVASG